MPNIQGMPFASLPDSLRICAESDQPQGCSTTQHVYKPELSWVMSGEHYDESKG